jgi:hypothetical protein
MNQQNGFKANLINKNKGINIISKIDVKMIIKTVAIIVLLCIVIVLGIYVYTYMTTECYQKKNFFEYLFDFSDHDVCIEENKPEPVKSIPEAEPMKLLEVLEKKQVFHIANQDYTYDQAKCKCESYNAKLATKNDMTNAYNNGANWCTYGWSDGQNAYYPVQQCDWDILQEELKEYPEDSMERKKRYCGNPGLNGGYFPNPKLKFGVNCYGVKPKGKTGSKLKTPYCPPVNFCKLDANFEASHKLDTDEISPFNNDKWSQEI